jgi:hypothetical protein
LNNEGKCWPEFYKHVKRRKEFRENIPAIKDCNGRPIIDPIEKVNSFNYYYASVFSSEGKIQHIQCANPGEPFTIDTNRKMVTVTGNKSIGPGGISEEILKLGSHDSIPWTIT